MEEILKAESPTDYITLQEIQDFLGMSEEHARALVRSAYFPSFKCGSKGFIIPRTAFMRFITDPDRIVAYKLKTYKEYAELLQK